LVLLIDPDEESLVVVVEDTTAGGPVAVEAASLEETVTLPKKILLVSVTLRFEYPSRIRTW
jgi:hypothetical protein